MKKLSISITLLITSLALASPALADHHEPSGLQRSGLVIGFGLHAGDIDCEGCEGLDESGGADFHIGGMISHNMAILFDVWAMTHVEDQLSVTHTIATVAAQFWLAPRIWVKGGLGGAQGSIVLGDVELQSETVPAVMFGAGLELLTTRRFALDVELRAGTGFYDGGDVRNAGIGVGFTWF